MWSFSPTGDGYYKFSPGSNSNGSIAIPTGTAYDNDEAQRWTGTGATNQQVAITSLTAASRSSRSSTAQKVRQPTLPGER